MKINLSKLETEQSNKKTKKIDQCSTQEILQLINEEDQSVALAVQNCLPEIAVMVEHVSKSIENGGRIFYVGAGTSGRLGFLDAAECPPTYGVSYDLFKGIIAGGISALYKAKEGAEDNKQLGEDDLIAENVNKNDVVIGIAASGRTPYVIGALDYAHEVGAYTGSIACVSHSLIGEHAQCKIEVITGPEVITGSTRMKAGTAQKMVLNMISTAAMIKNGKVFENWMVDVMPTNEKLVERAVGMIERCVECPYEEAKVLFKNSKGHVKSAICMGLTGRTYDECILKLNKNHGHIRSALNDLKN